MTDFPTKTFSGGSVFLDNKAFWKLRFARCLKKGDNLFRTSLSITEHLEICQKWAQKSSKSFSDLLLHVPLCGGGYLVFMLSVKPELEQTFYQLYSDVVLHIRVIIAVHFGEVTDICATSALYTHRPYSSTAPVYPFGSSL